jgi:hypothetical protein
MNGPAGKSAVGEIWYLEVWGRFRPYSIEMTVDFLVFVLGMAFLGVSQYFEPMFHVSGNAALFMSYVHEGIIVASTTAWLFWSVLDIWAIRSGRLR